MKVISDGTWNFKITEYDCKRLYESLKKENKLCLFLDLIGDKDLQIYLRNKKLKKINGNCW